MPKATDPLPVVRVLTAMLLNVTPPTLHEKPSASYVATGAVTQAAAHADDAPSSEEADTSNPVTIFTIQVNIGNADAKSQVLQDCATEGNFQMITDSTKTSDAFANVLAEISKLRVAR